MIYSRSPASNPTIRDSMGPATASKFTCGCRESALRLIPSLVLSSRLNYFALSAGWAENALRRRPEVWPNGVAERMVSGDQKLREKRLASYPICIPLPMWRPLALPNSVEVLACLHPTMLYREPSKSFGSVSMSYTTHRITPSFYHSNSSGPLTNEF